MVEDYEVQAERVLRTESETEGAPTGIDGRSATRSANVSGGVR